MESGGKMPDITTVPTPSIPACLTGITARFQDGLALIDYYFQGARSQEIQTDLTQSAQGSLTTEPITSHPKINELVANYANGLRSGQVLWKDFLSGSGSSGTTLSGASVNNINPFSNVDSYLYSAITYNITQSFSSPPPLQISRVGKIALQPIFGYLPQLSGDFSWLYAGFDIEQYGFVYRITLKYLKSAKGGWQTDIYA